MLEHYKFDFKLVTDEINRVILDVNKKLNRPAQNYTEAEIRERWTFVENQIRNKLRKSVKDRQRVENPRDQPAVANNLEEID